jgi:predicted membrane protein
MKRIKETYKKSHEKIIANFGTSIIHDPIMLTMAGVFSLVLLIMLLIIIFRVQPAAITTPMVYNVVYGVTDIGNWYALYYYFIACLILGILNLSIAWAFFDKERLVSYLLAFVNIIIAIIITISVFNLTALTR